MEHRPELMEQLDVFEVDHPPATQEFKLHRLIELMETPAKLHFILIDFTKEKLITALTHSSSSYDPSVKSFLAGLVSLCT